MWTNKQDPYKCNTVVNDEDNMKSYQYDLSMLYHEPEFSDGIFYQGDRGTLTYVNLCGTTTTACDPASPVCQRSGVLYGTTGYGSLESQKMGPIGLFLLPRH